MSNLVIVPGAIRVQSENIIEGEIIVEVSCSDYAEFRVLPAAVKHHTGKRLVKSGWNSDKYRACYKTERLGQLVDIYA